MRLLMIALAASLAAPAHDIPNDVTVQAFLKPEGQRLRLLVRAPMKAMRDVEFPQKGPGYLDLARSGPFLADAATLWIADAIAIYEGAARLPKPQVRAAMVSLESDRSFATYEDALARVTGAPLPLDTNVVWNQTMLDVLFEYPIQSEYSEFAIHPALDRLGVRTVTALRFLVPQHSGNYVVRAFEFDNDPGIVKLDPRWYQASLRFVREGFLHILDGTDHLLFLLCLVIPFRRFRGLIPVVTAFTVAHSITLIASAYNLGPDALWFPPLIETLIAASIVYMALENIVTASTVKQRWMIAFGFGLVHGFGFSFALKQTLQFAGGHLLTSLLSFNIGVELGQLLVLAVLVPALELLFRYVVAERMGTIVLSALVAHTAWHWMMERFDRLRQFRFGWPEINAAFLAGVLRSLTLLAILAALWWLGSGWLRRFVTGSRPVRENE
ncbi:MAG: HupE/UreJ family protein [Acidobacteriota bacterium]|nr:HupE/UreJ family protein [Acidobacteriota bacterium]